MDYKQVLRDLLAKVYPNKPHGDIDAILDASENESAALSALLEIDKARVVQLTKPKEGHTFQDGYKKAKAEALSKLEEEIKTTFSIESEAQGLDLINEIVAEKSKPAKSKEITDDDVQKHPFYKNAVLKNKTEKEAAITELQKQLQEVQSGYKREKTFETVAERARRIRDEAKVAVPGNSKLAANIEKAWLATFAGYDFETSGDQIHVSKDGKLVDDGHGNPLTLDKLLKDSVTDFYEIPANNGGQNGGNGKPAEGGKPAGNEGGTPPAYPAGIVKPKTAEELSKIVSDSNIPAADRRVVMDTWKQENEPAPAQ